MLAFKTNVQRRTIYACEVDVMRIRPDSSSAGPRMQGSHETFLHDVGNVCKLCMSARKLLQSFTARGSDMPGPWAMQGEALFRTACPGTEFKADAFDRLSVLAKRDATLSAM